MSEKINLQDSEFSHIFEECEMIGKMLGKLIKVRTNS
jgi:hypothetical protein